MSATWRANVMSRSRVITWICRVAAVLSLLILGLFVVAHMLEEGGAKPTPTEWLGLSFFPLGTLVGTALALGRPLTGGLIVLLSLIGFYAWHLVHAGDLPGGPYFVAFSLPGIALLANRLLEKMSTQSERDMH